MLERVSGGMGRNMSPRMRLPLMALGMLALAGALVTGLMRLGYAVPAVRPGLAAWHGPLMVSGFLGTLIALERAVALNRAWNYLAPLFAGAGAFLLLAGFPGERGALLMTVSGVFLVSIFLFLYRLQPELHMATMTVAAVCWLTGNALWLAGRPLPQVVYWWAGYLVLTIVGERLELSRLLRLSSLSRRAFLAGCAVFLLGIVLTALAFDAGVRLIGAGMLMLTAWLLRHDMARRTVRQSGLTKYISICLLSGYGWLGVGGLLAMGYGGAQAGPHYDAVLHSVFLGFVFAMIFGHAPIIFPAVLGLNISFRPAFYVHLVLLHITLALRVAGDLTGWLPGRRVGGLLNVIVLVIFLVNTGYAILRPAGKAHRRAG